MHPRRDSLTEADQARVADVFTTHQRFLENVARAHAPSPDHVPDIVQAVGVQICRGLNGFRGDAELRTWLYRVTVNTARTYSAGELRHRRRVEAVQATPEPEPYIDPDDQVQEVERREALHEAIDRLKPFHQDLMKNDLRNDLGGSIVQIGNKTSRHRARRQLRQLLDGDPRLDS